MQLLSRPFLLARMHQVYELVNAVGSLEKRDSGVCGAALAHYDGLLMLIS